MEATKRERFLLFGLVPIVAAILGAVVTVVVGQMTGGTGGEHSQVMIEIVKAPGLTYDQKAKLMQMAIPGATLQLRQGLPDLQPEQPCLACPFAKLYLLRTSQSK